MVTVMEKEQQLQRLQQLRWMREIGDLDFRRLVRSLYESGVSQSEIARRLSVSQQSVGAMIQRNEDVEYPREGFSSASPMEVCQRYAAGMISQDQLVDELGRWEYAPGSKDLRGDAPVDIVISEPGTVDEVVRASHMGLLDRGAYGAVYERLKKRADAQQGNGAPLQAD